MNKKILITSIILITLINTIMPVVNAAQIINKANLSGFREKLIRK